MRSTFTLDDDVHQKLQERIRLEKRPAKEVYNDLLRMALSQKPETRKQEKFEIPVFSGKSGFQPGFDWNMTASEMLSKLDEDYDKKKLK